MSDLSAVLEELDGWLAAERPDLYPGLRPGLPEREIEDLEARLAPYRLPADLVTVFATALELWRTGLLPLGPDQWPDVRRCLVSHNPAARDSDGRSRLQRSTAPAFDWPESWLIAAGVGFPHPAGDSDVITIAELLADPSCERPVRGTFRTKMGSGAGWETGTLTDETGSIEVYLERESTENHRLVRSSNRFEMVVRPVTEGETVAESMAACEFGSELEESVTRRFLEASAASFDAIRVVPLPS